MAEPMIGTSACPTADTGLIREAGIGWVRQGFPFPFEDMIGGSVTEGYGQARAAAQRLKDSGLSIMGVAPGPGLATREKDADGKLEWNWHTRLPEWCGPPDGDRFLDIYEQACAWLAEDLKGMVPVWQIANELDIFPFAGPLDPRQACDLITRGARGLKGADPSLVVGHNPAGAGSAAYFFGYFHANPHGLFDYCGIDGYYGTWQPGGPQDWAGRIAELHALTGLPVLVNEWGFSSAGGVVDAEKRRAGLSPCDTRNWEHTWGGGHTPEGQAQFVEAAFDAFRSQRSALVGVFFYRWEDQERCWQCGSPDCPAETAWGLVDLDGEPKPAFHAFREGTRRFLRE